MICCSIWVKTGLVSVSVSKLTCFYAGIGIDLVFVWGSQITWHYYGGRKLTWT